MLQKIVRLLDAHRCYSTVSEGVRRDGLARRLSATNSTTTMFGQHIDRAEECAEENHQVQLDD